MFLVASGCLATADFSYMYTLELALMPNLRKIQPYKSFVEMMAYEKIYIKNFTYKILQPKKFPIYGSYSTCPLTYLM